MAGSDTTDIPRDCREALGKKHLMEPHAVSTNLPFLTPTASKKCCLFYEIAAQIHPSVACVLSKTTNAVVCAKSQGDGKQINLRC